MYWAILEKNLLCAPQEERERWQSLKKLAQKQNPLYLNPNPNGQLSSKTDETLPDLDSEGSQAVWS